MLIVLIAESMGKALPASLQREAARVKVICRGSDMNQNFLRSMAVSHDNVRLKPHVFYWIKAVPCKVLSTSTGDVDIHMRTSG
jgi:hypothetical protein